MVSGMQQLRSVDVRTGGSNFNAPEMANKFQLALDDAQVGAPNSSAKIGQDRQGAISPLSNSGISASAFHGAPIGRSSQADAKLILAQATQSGPLNLGDGYSGRLDRFVGKGGQAGFEVHVYKNGQEVGIYGQEGWFNKHGKTVPEVPKSLEERLKGVAVDELRKQGKLPDKGEANIKGKSLLDILRLFGKNVLRGPVIIMPPMMPECRPGEECGA